MSVTILSSSLLFLHELILVPTLCLIPVSFCYWWATPSFIMDQHKLGLCFLKHGDESEDDVTLDFMTSVKIKDISFRQVCHPEILRMLRTEFENVNKKIVSTYRKSLSQCKLRDYVLPSLCFCSSLFCMLMFFQIIPSREKE